MNWNDSTVQILYSHLVTQSTHEASSCTCVYPLVYTAVKHTHNVYTVFHFSWLYNTRYNYSLPIWNAAIWLVNSVALISVEPRWCFWQRKPMGEACKAWHRQMKWVSLVADGTCWWSLRSSQSQGWSCCMRCDFWLKLLNLLVTTFHLDHPHCHQMPNQTVRHTKIPHTIS